MQTLACIQCHENEEVILIPHSPCEGLRFVQQVGCISLAVHPYSRIIVCDVNLRRSHGNARNFHTFARDIYKCRVLNISYIRIFLDNAALVVARKIARNRS